MHPSHERPWLKSYPKNINWKFTPPAKPLYEILENSAKLFPNSNAIDFLGKKYTYHCLNELVNRTATGLQKIGVRKGTHVGLFLPNTPAYLIFYYGILKAGGTVVNFSPLYAEKEIAHQIKDSETEIMVTLDLTFLYPKIQKMLQLTDLQKIIICSLNEQLPFPKNILFSFLKRKNIAKITWDEHHLSFKKVINNPGAFKKIKVDPFNDIAVIQYTGGTTGTPKGAMLTHSNVFSNTLQAYKYTRNICMKDGKILAVLPFFHVFAMTAVMNLGVKCGFEIVMIFPKFEVTEAMRLIQKHKITVLPGVPTIFNMIANHPRIKEFDLSSIQACLSGGAPLPTEVKDSFERATKCTVVEGYGLSETSPVATLNPFAPTSKEKSIGIPVPGTTVKIMSLDYPDQEVSLGEKGEICIAGPQVMKGYWNKPQETQACIKKGLLHTGDVGYMDEDGFVYLVDRIKDLILCNGYNVYPRNVEDAIYLHPAIEEVIVIGLPHSLYGTTVKAYIKLKEGKTLSEKELLSFLEDKLSHIEMPKFIEFRNYLPKTMIGKLSKKDLIQEEQAKSRENQYDAIPAIVK